MKRFLRAFLNWLDRKFPDKVMVTAENWSWVNQELKFQNDQRKALEERIKALETQMANTQLALGFTAPKMGVLER